MRLPAHTTDGRTRTTSAPREVLTRAADAVLSVLLAPRCAACQRQLDHPTRDVVCPDCWDTITRITPPICDACGDPLPSWRVVSRAQRCCPALPSLTSRCRPGACHRRVRRPPSAHHPRLQVRRATVAGSPARGAATAPWRRPAGRGRLRRARAAPCASAACSGLQPGRRAGRPPRPAGRRSPPPHQGHAVADAASRRSAPSQRARCLRRHPRLRLGPARAGGRRSAVRTSVGRRRVPRRAGG